MRDGYPKEIWDIWPDDGGAPVLWREPCPFPVDDGTVIPYRRADLPATDAQAMQNEKVKALVERLTWIARRGDPNVPPSEILNPHYISEQQVREMAHDILGMARAALAAIKEGQDND